MSGRASKAHAEASLPGEPQTYDARSKRKLIVGLDVATKGALPFSGRN
jgi:hypothetical protein